MSTNKKPEKTTHELAQELLRLPNVPVEVEMWCLLDGNEPIAAMTDHDPDGTAIIYQGKRNE